MRIADHNKRITALDVWLATLSSPKTLDAMEQPDPEGAAVRLYMRSACALAAALRAELGRGTDPMACIRLAGQALGAELVQAAMCLGTVVPVYELMDLFGDGARTAMKNAQAKAEAVRPLPEPAARPTPREVLNGRVVAFVPRARRDGNQPPTSSEGTP